METVTDSGSSDNATRRATAPHVPVVRGAGSMRGQKLWQAGSGGNSIISEGEQNFPLATLNGLHCPMTYHVAGVRKSLTSVARICDRNNRVISMQGGAIIQNIDNGYCILFPWKGVVYTLFMLLYGFSVSCYVSLFSLLFGKK